MKLQRTITLLLLGVSSVMFAPTILAQDQSDEVIEEVVVTGIRGSLASSIDQRRQSDNLKEVIVAEDIGKLPDQNLAEVLENVPGVQITREAGVGTGVQIRGTNANRTEINGVSTVGSGSGRSGINFEDISAGIIAGVEVVKAPEAKTIEGSVGGTINLKTIRPLDLSKQLGFVRVQVEDSSLSTDNIQPRVAGAWGNNWSADSGEWGVVLAGTYSESDVTAFRPRVDRDNFVGSASGVPAAQPFDFLPIQFFIQDYDNYEYETINFAGTLEFAPSDELSFYFDTVVSDQTREQRSSRIQASGISGLRNDAAPDSFETINFGSLAGSSGVQNLGSIEAALTGVIPLDADGSDGNLRYSGDTNSRASDSLILSLGAKWQINDRLWSRFEVSSSTNDTTTPFFNTTLNFINPNSPLDYDALLANHFQNEANGNEDLYDSNENGTPFVYDLRGGSLTWGIEQSAAFSGPTTAQLLDPANVVLRDVNQSRDIAENEETAFRADFEFDWDWSGITRIDFGYRYNETTSLRDQVRSNVGLREIADSPRGNQFAELLVPGPSNFNSADGRALYVSDFLVINQDLAASDPNRVLAILNAAIEANNAITGSTRGPISEPTSSTSAFFDISEETHALYAQANFAAGIFRGNLGLRYLETDVESIGNTVVDGVPTPTSTKGSYNFVLPRLNLVADVHEDVLIRLGWGEDIRRPNFDTLSTSFTFSTSPNPPVFLGNPGLEPEEVMSFDIGVEWYFAENSMFSIGYFHKERTGLFVRTQEDPFEDPVTGFRDTTAPCEQGGIFNPIADINVFGPIPGVGVCVPLATTINGSGETTQQGVEVVFQYDLAGYEDRLGWASGFGFLANYTTQEFDGPEEYWTATSRASTVFAANGATNVDLQTQLIDLSESAYNLTLYYEKFGVSARMRYTWREAYRSTDFGSTSSFPWGFPVVQDDRGQLNASVNYIFNDHLTVGVEGINLTESDVDQYCVNKNALLCFQGLTDRRITVGASYRF